jgi:hypothetical protein
VREPLMAAASSDAVGNGSLVGGLCPRTMKNSSRWWLNE